MPEVVETALIDPASVLVSERLRATDPAWVEAIAASIAQKGQDTPIQVRRNGGGKLHLVAGAHRLAACVSIGVQVRAEILTCSELEARLIEIDENLFRRELGALDRAVFLAERKAVYEKMHPETKQGAQGGRGGKRNENEILSFSKETARRINLSTRTVEMTVRIALSIPVDVRARLAGTKIADRQVDLLFLAGLAPELQRQAVALVIGGGAKSLKAAVALIDGTAVPEPDASERKFTTLMNTWVGSNDTARLRFLAILKETGELESLLAQLHGESAA